MIYVIHPDGGHVSQGVKKVLVFLGVVVVFITLTAIDNFTYPFKAESPNFSDVDRAFNQLQFPSSWVEIRNSENRGLYGRGCDPFNDSGCFHKSKTFKVPETTTAEDVKKVLLAAGCPGIVEKDNTKLGESRASVNLNCSVGNGLQFAVSQRGPETEVYVVARTY